jgi:hypothetical protein
MDIEGWKPEEGERERKRQLAQVRGKLQEARVSIRVLGGRRQLAGVGGGPMGEPAARGRLRGAGFVSMTKGGPSSKDALSQAFSHALILIEQAEKRMKEHSAPRLHAVLASFARRSSRSGFGFIHPQLLRAVKLPSQGRARGKSHSFVNATRGRRPVPAIFA